MSVRIELRGSAEGQTPAGGDSAGGLAGGDSAGGGSGGGVSEGFVSAGGVSEGFVSAGGPEHAGLPHDELLPDDLLPGLRVGVDMDGVLADFNTGWMTRYNREFGTQLDASQVVHWDGPELLTHFASMDEFWTWARGEGRSTFRDAPALPGAVDAVNRIAVGHRLVIVSSKFPWAIPDSLAWLADHGVRAREVHFLWDKSIAACDVYLDDATHVLESLVATRPQATTCRMVRPWNAPVAGATDIESWEQFEALVEEVAARRQDGAAPR